MKITAKSSSKVDVRDGCSDLRMSAQTAEDVNMLTRLYRHIAGLETSTRTDRAIAVLRRPVERFTARGSKVVMRSRTGEWNP